MAIKVYLGNIGSGKTLLAVREISQDSTTGRTTFTNIVPKKGYLPNVEVLKHHMIFHRELVGEKRSGELVYDMKLNEDYWKQRKGEPMNIVVDEAHNMMNSRRSSSKTNIIMTDFIALARRVLGESDMAGGDLIFITQLNNSIDVKSREMAHQYRYHRAHVMKTCKECGTEYRETSDTPEQVTRCIICGGVRIIKRLLKVEVWHFQGEEKFLYWKYKGMKTYHRHYFVRDLEPYFEMYDTLQWDNLLSEMY